MTNTKTLLGPGYYNPTYHSSEQVAPHYTFERENVQFFDPKVLAEYAREQGNIKLDQANRKRDKIKHKTLLQNEGDAAHHHH